MNLNDFSAHPIAWDEGNIDYGIGEKMAVIQLIHQKRFNVDWVEYHHPRLTRIFYNAVRSLNEPWKYKPSDFRNKELAEFMFSWMQ